MFLIVAVVCFVLFEPFTSAKHFCKSAQNVYSQIDQHVIEDYTDNRSIVLNFSIYQWAQSDIHKSTFYVERELRPDLKLLSQLGIRLELLPLSFANELIGVEGLFYFGCNTKDGLKLWVVECKDAYSKMPNMSRSTQPECLFENKQIFIPFRINQSAVEVFHGSYLQLFQKAAPWKNWSLIEEIFLKTHPSHELDYQGNGWSIETEVTVDSVLFDDNSNALPSFVLVPLAVNRSAMQRHSGDSMLFLSNLLAFLTSSETMPSKHASTVLMRNHQRIHLLSHVCHPYQVNYKLTIQPPLLLKLLPRLNLAILEAASSSVGNNISLSTMIANEGSLRADIFVKLACSGYVERRQQSVIPGTALTLRWSINVSEATGSCVVSVIDPDMAIIRNWRLIKVRANDSCFCYAYCQCACTEDQRRRRCEMLSHPELSATGLKTVAHVKVVDLSSINWKIIVLIVVVVLLFLTIMVFSIILCVYRRSTSAQNQEAAFKKTKKKDNVKQRSQVGESIRQRCMHIFKRKSNIQLPNNTRHNSDSDSTSSLQNFYITSELKQLETAISFVKSRKPVFYNYKKGHFGLQGPSGHRPSFSLAGRLIRLVLDDNNAVYRFEIPAQLKMQYFEINDEGMLMPSISMQEKAIDVAVFERNLNVYEVCCCISFKPLFPCLNYLELEYWFLFS